MVEALGAEVLVVGDQVEEVVVVWGGEEVLGEGVEQEGVEQEGVGVAVAGVLVVEVLVVLVEVELEVVAARVVVGLEGTVVVKGGAVWAVRWAVVAKGGVLGVLVGVGQVGAPINMLAQYSISPSNRTENQGASRLQHLYETLPTLWFWATEIHSMYERTTYGLQIRRLSLPLDVTVTGTEGSSDLSKH